MADGCPRELVKTSESFVLVPQLAARKINGPNRVVKSRHQSSCSQSFFIIIATYCLSQSTISVHQRAPSCHSFQTPSPAYQQTLCFPPIRDAELRKPHSQNRSLDMAKSVTARDQIVKLIVGAGQASPSPPVGPALGSKGVKSIDFCKVCYLALSLASTLSC